MSQRSRQRLATDAEKLYAGQQLWLRLNETLLWVNAFVSKIIVSSKVS